MYRTFHLQHQQPAQKAMGALGITLRILKNLKPDPFCLFMVTCWLWNRMDMRVGFS
jgi:hypothetical protein